MDITKDIRALLHETGWSIRNFARESGVDHACIARLLNGTRKGLHSSSIEKLWPYLYGDKRPAPSPRQTDDAA